MKYDFLHKEAIYSEGTGLFLVLVVDQIENDWGIILTLKVLEDKIGYQEKYGIEIEYTLRPHSLAEFSISAQWGIVSYIDDHFLLEYSSQHNFRGILNFKRSVIEAFRRQDSKIFE